MNVQRKRDLQLTIRKLISQKDSIIQELEYAKKIIDSVDYENDIIEQSISELQTNKTDNATRYFISSLVEQPEKYQNQIRSHCEVENKLHWLLDVDLSEGTARKQNENLAQNYSIVLKVALYLFKNDKSTKQGITGKRLKTA